jgi:hypothetical protein
MMSLLTIATTTSLKTTAPFTSLKCGSKQVGGSGGKASAIPVKKNVSLKPKYKFYTRQSDM